jgi:hypothetical protein
VHDNLLSVAGRLYLRRFLAAAFMVVLLAEWGSHTFNHHSPADLFSDIGVHSLDISPDRADADSVIAYHSHDEDHCPTIICNDSNRHDQQVPNAGHQVTPANGILDGLLEFRPGLAGLVDPPLPFRIAHRLYGPPISQFHPPELS